MLFKNILVTGCARGIGFGVGRILKNMDVAERIIGCDIHEDHPGNSIFGKCYCVQKIGAGYIESLMNVVEQESIDLIIPTSELEIRHLYDNHFYGKRELFLVANERSLEIGFDKLATAQILQEAKLLYPWTKKVEEGLPDVVPCIMKARCGWGSKDVFIVREQSEAQSLTNKYQDFIWQEYLGTDNEEYTCGVYGCKSGEIRTIVIKRKLLDNYTSSGVIVCNEEIEQLLKSVANALNLVGSINVQLRMTNRGPVIFEINPRFSSTVVFRDLLGFKDLLWSLQGHLGVQESEYIPTNVGDKFYRLDSEIIFRKESDNKCGENSGGGVLLTNDRNIIPLIEWLQSSEYTIIYSNKTYLEMIKAIKPSIIISYNYTFLVLSKKSRNYRPGNGLSSKVLSELIGKRVRYDLKRGHLIQWVDVA